MKKRERYRTKKIQDPVLENSRFESLETTLDDSSKVVKK